MLDGNSIPNLEFIREYLVKPLADQFSRFEHEMRDQLTGMRADFKDALEQNRAILSTITDVESGYVPRSEHQLMVSKYDAAIIKLNERVDNLFRWLVTTGIAASALALEVMNLATHK